MLDVPWSSPKAANLPLPRTRTSRDLGWLLPVLREERGLPQGDHLPRHATIPPTMRTPNPNAVCLPAGSPHDAGHPRTRECAATSGQPATALPRQTFWMSPNEGGSTMEANPADSSVRLDRHFCPFSNTCMVRKGTFLTRVPGNEHLSCWTANRSSHPSYWGVQPTDLSTTASARSQEPGAEEVLDEGRSGS